MGLAVTDRHEVHPAAHTRRDHAPSTSTASAAGWESAVQSSAGHGVPRRFLWIVDAFVLAASVLAADLVAPVLQLLAGPAGVLREPAFAWLSLPDAATMGGFRPLRDLVWMPLVMAPSTVLFMELLGGYRPVLQQSRTRLLVTSLAAPFLGMSVVTVLVASLKMERSSRIFMYATFLIAAAGFLACRLLVRAYKRRRLAAGAYARNVVVIAPLDALDLVVEHAAASVAAGFFRLRGYLSTGSPLAGGSAAPSLPRLGEAAELGELLVHRPIHEVIAVTSPNSHQWLPAVVEQCDFFQVTLRIVPGELLPRDRVRDVLLLPASPLALPEIVIRPRLFDADALFAKRVFDLVLSAALLVLLAPLFALIAIAIKLTTPQLPVFYPWNVVGYKGRRFTGYKFTTMFADADDRKASLEHLNEMTGPVFKIKDDPRTTPLGKWLRRFSLNELPQFWSVLKGDMSLVGPRPAYPNELERYELWHKRKLCVQPGVTCLWQVRGRNKISSFDDWVRMDFEYIDNWSLWLDCVIVARTVWTVVAGSGS
jgi:exopolysaccharide biosynthesis polyprenyl glycosylphosphotransferase